MPGLLWLCQQRATCHRVDRGYHGRVMPRCNVLILVEV